MNSMHSTNTVVSICRENVVFCPTYRRAALTPPIKVLLAEQVERRGHDLIELEVMLDHIHLLVGCDMQFGIHRLVTLLKGYSTHVLRAELLALKRRLPWQ
jgi:putative transposase